MLQFTNPLLAVQEYLALLYKLEGLDPDTIAGHPRTIKALSDSVIESIRSITLYVEGLEDAIRATRIGNRTTGKELDLEEEDGLSPGTLYFIADKEVVARLAKIGGE